MIPFRQPTLEDRLWVDELFYHSNNRGCEYSFTNLFCWQGAYRQQVARMNDFVLERLSGSIGDCYLFPAGRGELKPVLDALIADAQERGHPCHLICVTPEDMKKLEAVYPGHFTYTTDLFGFDYLYTVDKLADLAGKKLHGKRNHIHRFEEAYPDWSFEEITPENLSECIAMDTDWQKQRLTELNAVDGESLDDEGKALRVALSNFQALALEGILIRAGGRVVAFTLGRPMSPDTFDVNFEKAYSDIQGAYPIVNRTFARWIREHHPEIVYLNREDDMGVEGLRKAKESYYPDLMVQKHSATYHP